LAGSGFLSAGLAAGAEGAGATTAGLASAFFSSFLAGSAAKAETANILAIRVAITFMLISFLVNAQNCLCTYIITPKEVKALTKKWAPKCPFC
jgi:hypothetical protein